MAKSIRLSEEAYDRLAGERSLLELTGILSDDEADALREAVEERRDRRAAELD
ncbi:hypothetical protein [Halorubrum sp. SD626R]|uniref:hypothetical protein n=1 Tax=Halorubrum sp. SD626R TaxID=1419722 RepID=UPI000B1DBD8B|nr:hypothetical protein [Halorubrum sp. SD626R]